MYDKWATTSPRSKIGLTVRICEVDLVVCRLYVLKFQWLNINGR